MTINDLRFMRIAIEEAKKSKNAHGKVPIYVGAVVAKNGKIIAKAHRGQYGFGEHAEYTALERVLEHKDRDYLKGATLYTTLEPCVIGSHGKDEKYRWTLH
ncbi:MAG: deaminase [Methanobacteriota archaeon]